MSTAWKSKSLDDACAFLNGLWKGEKPPFVNVGVIRNTNFSKDGTLDFTDLAYLDVEESKLEKRRLRVGDVILEKSGGGPKQPVGRVAFFDETDKTYSFSNFTAAIRVRDESELDAKFVHRFLYWLYVSNVTEGMQSHSTGIRNLDVDAYKAIEIRYPSLKRQRQVVATIDQALEGVAKTIVNTEKNLQNAQMILKRHRDAVFGQPGAGWLRKPLAELCDIKHGFAFKSEFFTDTGDYILLTPGNFFESGGYRDRGVRQKYYRGPIPDGFVLSEGDLLVAMTEQAAGLLGSPILVPGSHTFLHNQRLGLVVKKPGSQLSNELFFHIFNTTAVRKSIDDSATGVKVRHTSPDKIGAVAVAFPWNPEKQNAIVSTLNALACETEHLGSIYSQKLAALDALKKSLLHEAFSGNL